LTPALLDELIPPFEAVFDLSGHISVLDPNGKLYYGAEPSQDTGLSTPLIVEQNEIGRVHLAAQADDARMSKAVAYLATTLSRAANDSWRQNQLTTPGDKISWRKKSSSVTTN